MRIKTLTASLAVAVVSLFTAAFLMAGSDVIDRRQGIFENLEAELDRLDANEAWQENPERWAKLSRDVHQMKALYPDGSRRGSRSRRSVWKKSDDFMVRLDALALDLERMSEASVLGNETTFMDQWDEVDSSCLGCHMRYKTLF